MAKNLMNLVKGGCHSNQFCDADGDKLVYLAFIVFVLVFATDENIDMQIIALISTMISLRLIEIW